MVACDCACAGVAATALLAAGLDGVAGTLASGLGCAPFLSTDCLASLSFSIVAFLAVACARAALAITAAAAAVEADAAGAEAVTANAGTEFMATTSTAGDTAAGKTGGVLAGAKTATAVSLAGVAIANDASAAGLPDKNLTPSPAQARATTPATAQTKRCGGFAAAIGSEGRYVSACAGGCGGA